MSCVTKTEEEEKDLKVVSSLDNFYQFSSEENLEKNIFWESSSLASFNALLTLPKVSFNFEFTAKIFVVSNLTESRKTVQQFQSHRQHRRRGLGRRGLGLGRRQRLD